MEKVQIHIIEKKNVLEIKPFLADLILFMLMILVCLGLLCLAPQVDDALINKGGVKEEDVYRG